MAIDEQVAMGKSSSIVDQEERKEFETVASALKNSSRLLRLLTYIGDKYFQHESAELHEYDIATEVFGRSKTNFNGAEDAVVRVEIHRLRKRLKEYYLAEGAHHTRQLTIPPGSYSPVFIRPVLVPTEPEVSAPAVATLGEDDTPTVSAAEVTLNPLLPKTPSTGFGKRQLWMLVTLLSFLFLAFGVYRAIYAHKPRKDEPSAAVAPSPTNIGSAVQPLKSLRILAGYSGKPQIDEAGLLWQPDQFFRQGGTWTGTREEIERSNEPLLFKHWRNGVFSYDIPLEPGVYELHLYFLALQQHPSEPATFTVLVNGKLILGDFDVGGDALGPNVADERVFRDISPAPDGELHLEFTSERATPALNAIEILPGIAHTQLPVRLVMQPRPFTDHLGQFWQPDNYFLGGYVSTRDKSIKDTQDSELYAAERYGHFTYAIPVDTRGRYTVILHFAESYFGTLDPGGGGTGSRLFRVFCNGKTLLDNFDIYQEAGSLTALTKTFYHISPSAQGKINLTFEPIVNNASVSGIEVIDESR